MRNKKDEGLASLLGSFTLLGAVIGLWAAAIYGYVFNIITLLGEMDTTSTTETVIRLIGIVVAPAGAIMGYF